VDRLGYFTEVTVDTQEVPGSPDQVDLALSVIEKPTGTLQLGAGYSTAEKVSFNFGISQENVFGSGNYLGLNLNTSKYNRTIQLTSTDPYFTQNGISRTFDIYYRTTRPYYAEDGDYRLVNEGGSLRFGVPFSEVDTVYFGVGLERYSFDPGSNIASQTPQAYRDYFGCQTTAAGIITSCTNDSVWGIPLTVAWARDGRDSALVPTRGRLQRANLEIGTGGDMKYYKGSYQYQQFFPISKAYTFAINGEVGYGRAYGDQVYPIFKNFYAGGLGSIRGFEQNSLGPRDAVTTAALGGTKKAIFNAEINAPFPGAGNDRTLRMYGFFDVGNVFTDRQEGQSDIQWEAQKKLRASVGLGISWVSPLGPLRIAYAIPVQSQNEVRDPTTQAILVPEDRIQRVQFQIGTSF
jgi:outer membrane protein insertion porin family